MRSALLVLALLCAAPASGQPGTLDPDFGVGGVLVDDVSLVDRPRALAVLPSGEIVVAGRTGTSDPKTWDASLVRYTPTGTRLSARSYGLRLGGCFDIAEWFEEVIAVPDGSVFASGWVQSTCSGGSDFYTLRVPSSGDPVEFVRPAFSGGGETAYALALQADGRLLVAGEATDGEDLRNAAFTRHLADGQIDGSFGTNGETALNVYGDHDRIHALAVQTDGRIVATGFASDGGQRDLLLVRLDADGTPDETFGDEGVVTLDVHGGDDTGGSVAVQPDGRILVAGWTTDSGGVQRFLVARFLPDGALDSGFGMSGTTTVDPAGLPASGAGIALQTDGKVVVAGTTETGAGGAETRDVVVARLLSDGSLDPGFGVGGLQTADWTDDDVARGLAITPDGNLLVAGWTRDRSQEDVAYDIGLAQFVGDAATATLDPDAPSSLDLLVAPNPTAPGEASVQFTVREAGPVRLVVLDALGREVAVLADGLRQPGTHTARLDAGRLAPGLYLVRLAAAPGVAARPLTVVR